LKAFIDTSERFYVRSLLLISVLAALCISEGVGLQLLPIPTAPSAPAPDKSSSGRVEIVSPKMEAVNQESIQIQSATIPTGSCFSVNFSRSMFSLEESSSGYSDILIFKSVGRAPPFSV
jgi:hypothetical protein